MKLVMTLLVRDEEDIVAANLDYHLHNGVDFVIATDNLSTDQTRDILLGYERDGRLHYIFEPDDTYSQHRWVTHMARLACTQFGADWVINDDADEFWWPEHGNLKDILAKAPNDALALVVPRTNFVPRPRTAGRSFLDDMTVRERVSLNPLGNPLPPKVCHRALPDIEVTQGNHQVLRNGLELHAQAAPISILHFPLRSYAQFENKIAKGGAAYSRNTELSPHFGVTWRRLYQLWSRSELEAYYHAKVIDDEALCRGLAAGEFVVDDRLTKFLSVGPPEMRRRHESSG